MKVISKANILLGGLYPYTSYSVRIAAMNSAGLGPYGTAAKGTTKEDGSL